MVEERIFYECDRLLVTMCGIIIDDEYILWSALGGGDLYRTWLKDYRVELEKKMILNDHDNKSFSNILRNDDKVYFIALFDGYKIIEYDLISKQLTTLYRHEVKGMQVYKAFLIDGKIFLFPSQLGKAVCIYSIKSGEVEYQYINWEELLQDTNIDYNEHLLFWIDCSDDIIFGVIDGTSYLFRIEIKSEMKCTIDTLRKDYKAASFNIHENTKYITLSDKDNRLICIGQDGDIEEIELGKGNKWAYGNVVAYDNKLFVLPNRNENIWVIDKATSRKQILSYPADFCRRSEWSLFFQPILHENKMCLLPHSGNGTLIINMDSCEIEYIAAFRGDLKGFLNSTESVAKRKHAESHVGEDIYRVLADM